MGAITLDRQTQDITNPRQTNARHLTTYANLKSLDEHSSQTIRDIFIKLLRMFFIELHIYFQKIAFDLRGLI